MPMYAAQSPSIFLPAMGALLLLLAPRGAGADEPLLERDVLPILTKNCLGCHGGLHQEAGLDLRTLPTMLAGGDSGTAIEPGHADESPLWERIASDDMPAGDDREKLSAEQKATIKKWIDAGLPTVSERQQNVDPILAADKQHPPREVAAAIDEHVNGFLAAAGLEPVPRGDDVEFLRRVFLDLTGRVPTARQTAEFRDSGDKDKRAKLIDSLLATALFGDQFGRTWRDWVCPPELPSEENAGIQPHQQARDFGKWLGEKFAIDEPWDKITRDILTVKGEIKTNPQVIFFGLVGQGDSTTADGSARAVASLFMGVQLQCARCHDDPYRDWSQQEHWALAAFFGRSQGNFKRIEIGKGPSKKPGEIAIPDSAFKNAGTTVPAAFLRGEEFEAGGDDDLREPLVDWLVAKDNPYFARSFVNRVWFYLFSRGIVNPIDDLRDLNPPSHPGLLKMLTAEFIASGYNVKHLFRCVCNSHAYQRTSWLDPATDELARDALTTAFGRMPLRVMTADMLYDSLKLAYGDPNLDLRTAVEHTTVGMSAAVADPYLEFQRRFGTNEEDATDFTHGVAQMLTLLNHPRLLAGSRALDVAYFPSYVRLPPIDSRWNEEFFVPVKARFVRFTVEQADRQPCLDELEVYGPGSDTNLALAANGAKASASSVVPSCDIYLVSHLNDGRHGIWNSWLSDEAQTGWAQIQFPANVEVARVVWSRDREGQRNDHVPRRYRIETSLDGKRWTWVSGSSRRNPPQSDLSEARLPRAKQSQAIEWLYLTTLSRRPTDEEVADAMDYVGQGSDQRAALNGVLWMLVNSSEYLLVR